MPKEIQELVWKFWWLLDVVIEQTGDTVFIEDQPMHQVFIDLVKPFDLVLAANLQVDLSKPETSRPADLWPPENCEPFCSME